MASYDNLMTEQPWLFRSAFADAWYSHASSNDDVFSSEIFESGRFSNPVHTPTVSGGSESEVFVSKHSRSLAPATGRVAKRKSRRASKRSETTTFITADPANFRRMVQQVTGVRFAAGNEQLSAVLMDEPSRGAGNEGGGLMPTLDTSAFLHDGGINSSSQPSVVVAGNGAAAAGEGYFESFCSFPTLESWRAV